MGNYRLLKIIINEDDLYKGKSLYTALVARIKEMGIAGATVTRGIEGYGRSGRIHTERILDLSASLPVVVEAVDASEKIMGALPEIKKMMGEGLAFTMEVERV